MSRVRRHQAWIILLAFCLSSQSFAQVEKFFAASGKKDLIEALVKASDAERAALLAEEKASLTAELAQSLIRRGERFFSQGDYSQALDVCRLAQQIAEQIGARAEIARSLSCIGLLCLRQGNYAEALRSYQQSLAISESLKDRTAMADALCHTGNIHRRQGDYAQALGCYQRSLALSEEAGDKVIMARALNNTGNAHREQGNYPQALEYYEKSLAISQALRNKEGEARALKNIGHVHTSRRNYAQALEYYRRSLAISRALPNKVITARALTNIANVYRKQNRHEESLQFAERATEMARQLDLYETLWASRLIAGAAHHFLNRPDEARRAIEESIAVIETLRAQVAGGEQEQQRFFESRVAPYHAMVELLIAQNNPSEALTCAERAKARVLLDVISSGRINKAMSDEEQEQERRLNDQLVSLNTQLCHENLRLRPDPARLADLKSRLQRVRLDFEAFQTSLYAAHPELKMQRGEAQPLRLEEAGALIDAKTALLEFVVTDEKVFLFTITRQSEQAAVEVKAFALAVNEEDLTDRIERFRRMLSTADNRFARPARQLYDMLLSPAAEQLRGKSQLIIAPDGPLWELPFQALRTPRDRYLIEDCALFYAPSLTVLREMNESRKREAKRFAAPTLLAMGNPASDERKRVAHNDARLDPLPEAQRQVQALRRIYGPDNSEIYIGADASEERFKSLSGDYRILHLAMHGILDDRNPMYSHLLFAQTSEKEDGLLEAWELMKMELKADLAVLSACETARGRVGRGEGIIGLTWALFVAGAPTTVVSQWKVRSDSAAELMIEFHRQLKARLTRSNERTSAAESLRAAALKLMRDGRYQHPFHWAGFVVIGDGY